MSEAVELEGVDVNDIKSLDPHIRLIANQAVARNEIKVYGRVTNKTAEIICALEKRLGK